MHDPPVDLAPVVHHGRLVLTHPEFAPLYRAGLQKNLAERTIWRHPKQLYGHEVPAALREPRRRVHSSGLLNILE